MKAFIYTLMIVAIVLSGCSNVNQHKGDKGHKKLRVVTTFYPMYYFTKQVTGDLATVDLLVPNGAEPHDWEPTTKDLANIQDADVFVYNSRYFETWTEKVLKSIDTKSLKVVEASADIPLMDALSTDEQNGKSGSASSKDPHVWLSPVLAQQEVDSIEKALILTDPKNKNQYEQHGAAFKAELANLDSLYKKTFAKAARKEFVTQHAAFGYLAKQYGLKQIPIAGLSPDVEPTLGKLEDLAVLTKKERIKVIYFEGLTSSKVAQTLANEIGATTEVLNPLEGLTKEDQQQGMGYIEIMKKNLETLNKSMSK